MYITGSAFADIKSFGSVSGLAYLSDDEFSLDSTGAGGGLRIGTFLHPRWTLELAIDAGSKTEVDFPDPFIILAVFPAPIRNLDLKASTQFLSVSTVVGFHPPSRGRVRVGYLAGFSFVRGTYRNDYSNQPVPLFGQILEAIETSRLLPPSSAIFPPPRPRTLTQKHNTGGLLLGFEAAVSLRPRLSIVPEVRALMFSTTNQGPAVFLIRPGICVRWAF